MVKRIDRKESVLGPRILTLDIETAPLESYHWGLWDQNIQLDAINIEWSILCFSAKWFGDRNVIYRDTGGRGVSKVHDDKALTRDLWRLLDLADIVIVQNGIKFDIRKINARMIMHKMKPYSPIKIVDTLVAAKKIASFTSNKLEWLSKHLTPTKKSKHVRFPGFKLWAECLKDNPAAWAEMRKYNIRDTVATEQLYVELRPWIVGHPNVAAYSSGETVACPKCGSRDLQKRGSALTQSGEYHRYRCNKCGGWARSRYTLNSMHKRHANLSN